VVALVAGARVSLVAEDVATVVDAAVLGADAVMAKLAAVEGVVVLAAPVTLPSGPRKPAEELQSLQSQLRLLRHQ